MIIFMGVAGSGKSVQGKMLADELGLPWLSTGEFLRMLIAGEMRREMRAGKLVEDEKIIALIQKVLTLVDTSQEFVLDGFPRTVRQADWLLSQVKHGQLKIGAIIHLKATEEVVKTRLLQRGRPDDHTEAITERFNEYNETILPILEHFKSSNVPVHEINGELAIYEVHEAIMNLLKNTHVHKS